MENNQELPIEAKKQHQTINRKNRRSYLKAAKVLKAKSKLNFAQRCDVIRRNQENGKQKAVEFENQVRENLFQQLTVIENNIRLSCNEAGYTSEQTDAYIAKWQESITPWPNK